jgi:hypothetical protein
MNLNFDNKAWMLIFIVGFVVILLTSKCLCNSENFIEVDDGKIASNYTIKFDKNVFVLCDSKKEPLQIDGSKITITIDNKIKTIQDLKEMLDKSKTLNMSFRNNKRKNVSLILHDFNKDNIKSNNNILEINNAKFKRL